MEIGNTGGAVQTFAAPILLLRIGHTMHCPTLCRQLVGAIAPGIGLDAAISID